MVDAERALLRAALADPAAQRFMLLSDSCVPLYAAPLTFLELLAEGRSRVDACKHGAGDGAARMEWRWHPQMLAAGGVARGAWRKSGQWFMLTRRHAELAVADTRVHAAFAAHCYSSPGWGEPGFKGRFCVAGACVFPPAAAALPPQPQLLRCTLRPPPPRRRALHPHAAGGARP